MQVQPFLSGGWLAVHTATYPGTSNGHKHIPQQAVNLHGRPSEAFLLASSVSNVCLLCDTWRVLQVLIAVAVPNVCANRHKSHHALAPFHRAESLMLRVQYSRPDAQLAVERYYALSTRVCERGVVYVNVVRARVAKTILMVLKTDVTLKKNRCPQNDRSALRIQT